MINFKTQDVNQLVTRLLVLQFLHLNHTPDECEEMVKGTKVVEYLYDENGEPALFFNWEAMLFEIPLQELDYLALKLDEKTKKEEVIQGIITAQNQDEIDKQKAKGLLLSSEEILTEKLAEAGLVGADSLPVGKDVELINPEVERPRMTIHMNNHPALPFLPKDK